MPQDYDEDKFMLVSSPAIANASNAGGAPTQTDFNNLVAKVNAILAVLRDNNFIALD